MTDDLSAGSGTRSWPGRVAVAVVRGDPPQVYLAESDAVLGRLLALRLVATGQPGDLNASAVAELAEALREERWADAVTAWMAATGDVVDAYPDEEVVTAEMLDRQSGDIALLPLFQDASGQAGGDLGGELLA